MQAPSRTQDIEQAAWAKYADEVLGDIVLTWKSVNSAEDLMVTSGVLGSSRLNTLSSSM